MWKVKRRASVSKDEREKIRLKLEDESEGDDIELILQEGPSPKG
jgi:hypothetical protein